MKPVNVGIVGLGTVGSGTFNVLCRNSEDIARRAGREILVTHVGARRDNANADTTGVTVSRDIFAVAEDPNVDILVELIGGTTVARELVMKAIQNGKHIVTANKALIAEHGNEIFAAALAKGVNVAFEAAVAGGVPIIKAIREGLSANRIDWVAGIINGTGNFILTEMAEKGRDFDDVLKEAQALGYAEADPTFDVEGIDAAHKLTILASIAFGIPLQFSKTFTEGITKITREDVEYARELGYRIKHLGVTRQTEKGVELRVHPTLIPESRLIANVNGVMNAVMVQSDAVGPTLYYGPGAGSEPTASAVVADVVDVARALTTDPNNRVPHLAFRADSLSDAPILPIEDVVTGYYLRMHVKDQPGVLAKIAAALSDSDINIEAIIQKDQADESSPVPLIMIVRQVVESKMNGALDKIRALDVLADDIVRIRLETLDG
ncbi:homoserine dehydrogenase [Ketobacter alkanivorans]|uniref:Homoserine dehydrogenase n=1 Tax=Ketobacter alkanivorans TaxID=1917421 RepID=A0A2K9LK11_9GAMM|nr:homoserine dehydrogenase [Ketobacter alkanivorans]AUM11835.1 homoserine dehydrogenase [Ketobacter alkanivorans]MCP5016703.1 homoserine dehydrogenase [Ketobacter sp.]